MSSQRCPQRESKTRNPHQTQGDSVLAELQARFPKAAELLAEAKEELLAFTSFAPLHWRQIWSNNPLSVNRLSMAVTTEAA